MKFLKAMLLKTMVRHCRRSWKTDKYKILIQTNQNGFSEKKWQLFFSGLPDFNSDVFEWHYVRCSADFIKLTAAANAVFCFHPHPLANWRQPELKLVYFGLNGVENIDQTMFLPSTQLEFIKGLAAELVAEYALGLALLMNRRLHLALFNQVNRHWQQTPLLNYRFCPLASQTIGVMGLGNIGRAVARQFSQLGCRVIGYDSRIDRQLTFISQWFDRETLADFLKQLDVLILTLPLTNQTQGLLGAAELALLKPNAKVINVARSGIVQTKALRQRLQKKDIFVVADVFDQEPLPVADDFWEQQQMIVTPHVAGNVNLIAQAVQQDFWQKLKAVFHV
jgi:phosphoglycerate dehydrogenase-like enzyme